MAKKRGRKSSGKKQSPVNKKNKITHFLTQDQGTTPPVNQPEEVEENPWPDLVSEAGEEVPPFSLDMSHVGNDNFQLLMSKLNQLHDDISAVKVGQDVMNQKLNNINKRMLLVESNYTKLIQQVRLQDVKLQIVTKQVNSQNEKIQTLTNRIQQLGKDGKVMEDYDPEFTIVAMQMPRNTGESPMDLSRRLINGC